MRPLDGGDLETTLRKHAHRKRWLAAAEALLASDRGVMELNSSDMRYGDEMSFYFDIPRSMWEPQLQAQVNECREQLAEMDRIAREYVETALKL